MNKKIFVAVFALSVILFFVVLLQRDNSQSVVKAEPKQASALVTDSSGVKMVKPSVNSSNLANDLGKEKKPFHLLTPKDKAYLLKIFKISKEEGFAEVYRQLVSGELDIGSWSPQLHKRMTNLILDKSNTKQLEHLIQLGLVSSIEYKEGYKYRIDIIDSKARTQNDKAASVNKDIAKEAIEKLKVLEKYNYFPKNNNFHQQAVMTGESEVLKYLESTGKRANNPDQLWVTLLHLPINWEKKDDIARTLFELGYVPDRELISEYIHQDAEEKNHKLMALLRPYLM